MVAAHPPAQAGKAGNPLAEATAPGMAAPVLSVVRSVLYGLKAAVLLVEPPSAACHSSRSATLLAVAGAASPCRTQSSHPGGSGVKPPPWADAWPPEVQANVPRPRLAVARATTNPTVRTMRVMRGRSGWVIPPMERFCPHTCITTAPAQGPQGLHVLGLAPTRVSDPPGSQVIPVVRNVGVRLRGSTHTGSRAAPGIRCAQPILAAQRVFFEVIVLPGGRRHDHDVKAR